jgi:hypothetical protein
MSDTVFARFVPKNRQAMSRMTAFAAPLTPNAAQAFAPNPRHAQRAQVELASRIVSALKAPENRLEASMSAQQFTEMFGIGVMETHPRGMPSLPLRKLFGERGKKASSCLLPRSSFPMPLKTQ